MCRDAKLCTEMDLQTTSCGLHDKSQAALNIASLGLLSTNCSSPPANWGSTLYLHSKFPAPKNERGRAPEQREEVAAGEGTRK